VPSDPPTGVRRRDLLGLMATLPLVTQGAAPLRRGINVTHWFRYPPSADGGALAAYLSTPAMTSLRRAGFDFVRLPVQPAVVAGDRVKALVEAIRRLQQHGFAVIVGPHPPGGGDPVGLLDFWARVAPHLAGLDRYMTIPEIVNEPVFDGDAAGWAALQTKALHVIRASLRGRLVLLTGNDWGGIDGLCGMRPADDPDTLYSFHFYEPPELTSLAAYRPGLDRAALARLPFPTTASGCAALDATRDAATRDVIRFLCATRWDAAAVDARIAKAAAWGARNRVPVLLGEFGASAALNRPARLGWLAAVRAACERRGIGWALWGYDDMMGFGIPAAPAGTAARPAPVLDGGVLAALGLA